MMANRTLDIGVNLGDVDFRSTGFHEVGPHGLFRVGHASIDLRCRSTAHVQDAFSECGCPAGATGSLEDEHLGTSPRCLNGRTGARSTKAHNHDVVDPISVGKVRQRQRGNVEGWFKRHFWRIDRSRRH